MLSGGIRSRIHNDVTKSYMYRWQDADFPCAGQFLFQSVYETGRRRNCLARNCFFVGQWNDRSTLTISYFISGISLGKIFLQSFLASVIVFLSAVIVLPEIYMTWIYIIFRVSIPVKETDKNIAECGSEHGRVSSGTVVRRCGRFI